MVRIAALALAVLAAGCSEQPEAAPAVPAGMAAQITITVAAEGDWTVAYTLPAPATELVFARSPDASRGEDWHGPDGFEIVLEGESERARRVDGEPFTSVSFVMSPRYRELPKDYAPFMPFGDGGRLFYTGRLFACAGPCADDAAWSFSAAAPEGLSVLVNGERFAGQASWTDREQGRNVYIGDAEPVDSGDVMAVIDSSLPPQIRDQLEAQLPRFMAYFTQKLGALDAKPMLFASYDVSPSNGRWGRQGGTLPGQVFTHFYGDPWPAMIDDPALPGDLAWFFAHEAGHLYQHDAWADGAVNAWIHEGGAEAFAALAMRADGAGDVVDTKIASAQAACAEAAAQAALRDAIEAGRFDAAYSCGLLISLAIDMEVREAAPGSDGLYTVWRNFIALGEGQYTEDGFLAVVAASAGQAFADEVRAAVRTPGAAFGNLGAGPG
jgi:hypothetical protein